MRTTRLEHSYPCVWFDGQVADGRPVLACVVASEGGDVLVLVDPLAIDQVLLEIPVASLHIEWRAGDVAGLITVRGSDQSIEFAPTALLQQLGAARGASKTAPPPSMWRWLGAAVVLAIVGTMVLPPLTETIAERLPASAVAALQTNAMSGITTIERDSEDDRVFAKILHRLDAKNVDVVVIQGEQPNAFALPGRKLLVTEPLLCEARSPAELIGVIAHELGHLEHRHAEASWLQSHLLRGLTRVPTVMTQLSMSRDAEREADRFAAAALDKAGVSKRGLREFFSRQSAATYGVVSLLSTHPSDEERLAAIGTDAIAMEIGLGPVELAALRQRHCVPANAPPQPPLPQTPPPSTARMGTFDGTYYLGDVERAPLFGPWLQLCDEGTHVELQAVKLVAGEGDTSHFTGAACDRFAYFQSVPGLPKLRAGKRRIAIVADFDSEEPFRFAGRDYRIAAVSAPDQDTSLVLTSGDVSQPIFVAGTGRSSYSDIVLAGDLDGDKRLDLILETVDGARILYLSSAAREGELVRAVVETPPPKTNEDDADADDAALAE